jgi:hypothetical protein
MPVIPAASARPGPTFGLSLPVSTVTVRDFAEFKFSGPKAACNAHHEIQERLESLRVWQAFQCNWMGLDDH